VPRGTAPGILLPAIQPVLHQLGKGEAQSRLNHEAQPPARKKGGWRSHVCNSISWASRSVKAPHRRRSAVGFAQIDRLGDTVKAGMGSDSDPKRSRRFVTCCSGCGRGEAVGSHSARS